ncbi:MAG TPA: adenine phosphoribosyltransferase [Candidatus Eisenbacteria bacterium]|nr:adenine phosphoribosyltransferase [Candidatus Eisenbacteria bacterium]
MAAFVRDVPDFPRAGILFKDITPLLHSPDALAESVRRLAASAPRPDAVVAIESRGFVFGTGLALHWGVPFVPARKFGKLPGRTVHQTYALEYGEDRLELHADALAPGQRVAIVDDLLATGGTALATVRLVEQLGAVTESLLFVIELEGLGGRERLAPHRVEALLRFQVTQ